MKLLPLLLPAALLLISPTHADRLLIPVHHVPVQDVCDALVRNPNLIPRGITRLRPLDERDAIIAEGPARAVGELREIVMLLDQPTPRIAVEVGLVVAPGAEPRRFNPAWFTAPDAEPTEPHAVGSRGRFDALLRGYRERGGEILLSRTLPTVLVGNSALKTVWLDADFAGLCDPGALASGVLLSPRINRDGTVTVAIAFVAAVADPAGDVRFSQQSQIQATVADGDRILYGGHFLGEGEEHRQEVVLVVIPSVVFGGER